MSESVLIKSLPGQQLLTMREVTPQPAALPARLDEIAGVLQDRAIPYKAFRGIVLYHQQPDEEGSVDVGIPLGTPVPDLHIHQLTLPDGEPLTVREAPAIQIAACLQHRGDYDHLPKTRAALSNWIEDNGYQISGPGRMVYLNPPQADPLAELQFPVVKTKRRKKPKK